MNTRSDINMTTIIDHGGPMFIPEDTGNNERVKGIIIDSQACDNPDCTCRDIYLKALEYASC